MQCSLPEFVSHLRVYAINSLVITIHIVIDIIATDVAIDTVMDIATDLATVIATDVSIDIAWYDARVKAGNFHPWK